MYLAFVGLLCHPFLPLGFTFYIHVESDVPYIVMNVTIYGTPENCCATDFDAHHIRYYDVAF